MSYLAKQHPIRLFSYSTRYFWLLIIPVARSLYSLTITVDALHAWLKGTWLDLLILIIIAGFAYLRWQSVFFEYDKEKIIVTKGIFATTEDTVFYGKISTLSIKQGVFYKIIGAYKVYIATNAGIFDKADITIVMKKRDAEKFYSLVKGSKQKSLNYSISPNKVRLFVFSLLFSSALSGALVALTLIVETSQMFDKEVEAKIILDTLTEVANRVANFVPPIVAGIVTIIGLGWVISFVTNVTYFWNYILTKCSDCIYIKSGLWAKNSHIIPLEKVNYIDIKQGFLSKLFGASALHCHCSGYGSTGRSELSVVMPLSTRKEIVGIINEVFPSYPKFKIQIKPSPRSYGGFMFYPLILSLIPIACAFAFDFLLPDWSNVIKTATIILEIPALWLGIAKVVAIFTTGIGFNEEHLAIRYSRLYAFHTVLIPKEKITKLKIRQTPWQKASKTCSVIVYSASDSKARHIAYGLKLNETLNILQENGFDLYS